MSRTSRFAVAVSLICVSMAPVSAFSAESVQSYPSQAVRIIVPKAPGGVDDTVARIIAPRLQAILEKPVVVDNRPGAAGIIGTIAAIQSPPDGYTLLLINSSSHVVAGALREPPSFDPLKDFTPVALLATYRNALISSTSVPAKTLREFIELAKQKPGEFSFGSGGIGSLNQLAVELIMQVTGTKMVHVPYKGGGEAVIGLNGGQIHLYYTDPHSALSAVRMGNARLLAQTGTTPAATMPDVPLIAEPGLEALQAPRAIGLVGPPGMSAELVQKINALVQRALANDDLKAQADKSGLEIATGSPADFATIIADDVATWVPLAKRVSAEAKN